MVPTEALIREAQGGNRDAFDQLARLLRGRLQALICARLGPELSAQVEVEDVLQETLTRAYGSIVRFRWQGDDSLMRWLGGIAENVILKEARRARRSHAHRGLDQETSSGEIPVWKIIQRQERFERLQNALGRLSPDHREVILLARVKRVRSDEIARRMQRSKAAVAQLLARALKKLRLEFGDTESLHLPPWTLDSDDASHE